MAICRFGDHSDVSVFYGYGCRLLAGREFIARDEAEMIAHLEQHKDAGHRIPPEAFEDLLHPESD